MEKRNHYTAEFKAKVVLELLQEAASLSQVASKYQLNPQMLSQWKSTFVKNAAIVFERKMEEKESRYRQIIGQQSQGGQFSNEDYITLMHSEGIKVLRMARVVHWITSSWNDSSGL